MKNCIRFYFVALMVATCSLTVAFGQTKRSEESWAEKVRKDRARGITLPESFDETYRVGPGCLFADINDALKAAGQNRRLGKSTRVVISGGVYDYPIVFDGTYYDEGEEVPFIAIESAEGEKVTISGETKLSGWEKRRDKNGDAFWTAGLGEDVLFHLTHRDGRIFPGGKVPNPWPGDVVDNGGLFCNGLLTSGSVMYYPVDDPGRLAPGAFVIDYTAGTITVSPLDDFSPDYTTLAVKPTLFTIKNTRNMVVRGIEVTASGWVLCHAGEIANVDTILIEHCAFNRNRWGGLSTRKVKNSVFANIDLIENGIVGTGGSWKGYIRNVLFRALRVVNNNWIGEKFGWIDWDPCGVKWAAMRDVAIEDCVFEGNRGEGLWLDTENRRVTITNCKMINNLSSGLMLEANMGPFLISGCEIYGNKKAVFISATNDITIEKTFIHDNEYAIDIWDSNGVYDSNGLLIPSGRGPHLRKEDFPNIDDGSVWESHAIGAVVRNCAISAHPLFSNPIYTHNAYGEGWGNDEKGYDPFAASLSAENNTYSSKKPEEAFIITGSQLGSLDAWKKARGTDMDSTMNNEGVNP